MTGAESYRFDGKRAVVVGGATGMGAATAELVRDLGGEVVVMDFADVTLPGVKGISLDLREQASIDAALDECGGPIHALFSCAGAADGTPGIEKINFIGHRHLIDRAIAGGVLARGAAIGMISSTAGLGWEGDLEQLGEYLDTPDFDAASAWIAARPEKANYMWSKRAVCAYVAREALPMLRRGIRINAILPGPTDTPLARANADLWLTFGADFREETGIEPSTSEQQATALAFLCSDAASYVNGITMITDAGYVSSGIAGSFPPATAAVEFITGMT
ncbi:MAG TPA: SDR family oxidoreductase [Acidimicrobiia bacterium]|nr:SDR family oxidoreductase [Acidimicrobiia bacterium]